MKSLSRRAVLLALGLVVSAGAPRRAAAAAPVGKLLAENEPAAKSVGYVANSRTVDLKANPGYKRSQTCTTCAFIAFGTGRQRACSVIGNRLVESAGWCKLWKLRGSR
jgi:High potential iron-sulfur protein